MIYGNIGFYYTHYQCLGHTTRVLTLAELIKKQLPSHNIYFIQGSKTQEFLKYPRHIKNFSLPFPLFTYKDFIIPSRPNDLIIDIRTKHLLNLVKKLNLSVFITEYFPLGRNICRYELLPSLYYLFKTRRKVISSVGYPIVSADSFKNINLFFSFYKKIFIHTPHIEVDYIASTYKKKRNKESYLKIFDRYSNRISFTGYIVPMQLNLNKQDKITIDFKQEKLNILVTRGAGAYYSEIISSAIKASDLLGEDFYFIIVAGPSTIDKDWKHFQALMYKKYIKNSVLIKYTSHMHDLMKSCDLCISTASYNTSVLLLYFKKNSILIPFMGYENMYYREQPSRARLLKDFIGSSIIDYDRLTPLKLAKEIRKKTTFPSDFLHKKVDEAWFKGKEVFLKEFRYLYKDYLSFL